MDLIHNVNIDVFSILILMTVGSHLIKNEEKGNLQYKLYLCALILNITMLLCDIMGRFDGNPDTFYSVLNQIGNFLMFALGPILASLWLMYGHHQIIRDEKKTKRLIYPLLSISAINFVILIFSQFTGYYYYIDSDNVYHRGELFCINVLIVLLMLITTLILVLENRQLLTWPHFLSLISLPVFPIIATVIQTKVYGTSLVLNSSTITLLLIFLNIQNEQINTDYLTGLNNRKRLDEHLKKKVATYSKDKSFSAIMIDVDQFKAINDNYGHKTGDIVLQDIANILKESFGRKGFVARFGGDEFCIILDNCNLEKLLKAVSQTNDKVEEYNRIHNHTYNLSLSMGYAVYDNPNLSMEDFFIIVDKLMYQNKAFVIERRNKQVSGMHDGMGPRRR